MFYYVMACEINKKRIKSIQKQQTVYKTCCKVIKTFCIHKIRTNSPKFNNTKHWRVTVNS